MFGFVKQIPRNRHVQSQAVVKQVLRIFCRECLVICPPVQERQALEEWERHLYRNTLHLYSDTWKGSYSNQSYGQEMSGLGPSAPFHARQSQGSGQSLASCPLSQLLFGGLFSASFIYTLLFQGEALAVNRSCAGVGVQHRAWHVGNSDTKITLPVAGG